MGVALVSSILGGWFVEPYGWIPLAAAILVMVACGEAGAKAAGRTLGIGAAAFRAWVPALVIPAVALTAGYAVAAATGNAQLGLGDTSPITFAAVTLVIVALASLEAVGEELGWRGYLLPRIAEFGRVRAGLISGLLWATWHVPLIYIAAVYHGGAGPLYMLPFGITIVAMSFIANELRMASGSTWPAVVFHGAHNGIWFQLGALTLSSTGLLAGIGDESGVIPMTLYSLIAVWIVVRRPPWSQASALAPH